MSVRRAQQEIDSREFAEWMVVEEESPGDPERRDLNTAFICATIANAMSWKRSKKHRWQDFMPKFRERRRQLPTVDELKRKLGMSLRMTKAAIEGSKGKRNG